MEPTTRMEEIFARQFAAKANICKTHNNPELLEAGFNMIPVDDLQVKATIKYSTFDDGEFSIEDYMLVELMHWFKFDFFKWMDSPLCVVCNQPTESRDTVEATPIEMRWGAFEVESYHCVRCDIPARFPRYNHPEKLLETRTGRCGEWANCFTFLCCSLGYDARLVFDWTDHAWTEVYSNHQQRWLHCDPCENVIDSPLMYEAGWGKKLSYVLAFSSKEVQDVVWRYTRDFSAVLSKRNQCREGYLLRLITEYQDKMSHGLTPEEKGHILTRRMAELITFLTPPELDNKSYGGRTSGSLAWRLARGETDATTQSSYIFRLEPEEVEKKYLHVRYSCADDKYLRGDKEVEKWGSCVFHHANVFRKVEQDWKKSYLARTEGSDKGTISWKFDFDGSNLVIDTVKIRACHETFETGTVTWILKSSDSSCNKTIESLNEFYEVKELTGCSDFILTAELKLGTGSCSWQHAQLFRQSLGSNQYPLEIEIFLKDI